MRESWLKLLFIIFCICGAPLCSNAQFNLLIAGKTYHVDAFKDNDINAEQNQFVKDGVVPSIRQSKFDVEIRFNFYGAFGWFPGEGHCVVLRGNKNKLEAIDYYVHKFAVTKINGVYEDSGRVLHKYDIPQSPFRLGVYIKPLKPTIPLATLLQRLLDNHVSTLPNDDEIVKQLHAKGVFPKDVNCMDCISSFGYEVKMGQHYRSFWTSNIHQAENQDIPELNYELEIDKVFRVILPNL